MPLVSIIVPVYNAEKTLHRCLDSLVSQTYQDIEILLVDDGSCDGSAEICLAYCDRYPYIKLLQQENGGPATARNTGIDHAEGKYVYFVDSDDYVERNLVETMVTAAETTQAEMVICSYFNETEGGEAVPHVYSYKTGLYVGKDCERIARELINDVSKTRIPPYSPVRMILRSSLENPRIRYEDGMVRSEDYHFFVRLHSRLHRVYILNEPLYHYVEVGTSVTNRYVPNYWDSVKKIYLNLKQVLSDEDEIGQRLNIMLLQRALIALNNSTRASGKEIFRTEARDILKDKLLQDAVDSFSWRDGLKNFKAVYMLLKLKLYALVMLRYEIKHARKERECEADRLQ